MKTAAARSVGVAVGVELRVNYSLPNSLCSVKPLLRSNTLTSWPSKFGSERSGVGDAEWAPSLKKGDGRLRPSLQQRLPRGGVVRFLFAFAAKQRYRALYALGSSRP